MADLIERFVADQRERGRTRNTIDLRLRQLRLYEREFGPLSDATGQSIEDWLASRTTRAGAPLTAKTVNAYLVTFSVFFEWASEEGAVKANPITGIQRPTGDSEPAPPISDEDLGRAIEAARNPIRCMIVLGTYAGLAPQEIAFIDRGDVDDASEQPSLKVTHGKAGRVRSVPLVAEALQALNDLPMPERGRLFPTARASSVSQRINRHLHGLGIESTANSLQAWFGFEELRNSDTYVLEER